MALLVSLYVVACGEDDREPLEQSDSAVSAAPDGGTGSDAARADTGVPIEDARAPDVAIDANVPLDAGPDASACAGDACVSDAEVSHPLAGRYAVRTVSYTRQQALAAGIELDFVAKGVLLSVADVSASGQVKEQLCFVELVTAEGPFSWIPPASAQRIAGSTVTLARDGATYVRAGAQDRTLVSWSADKQPADCVPGTTHASGCACYAADTLPSAPDDCRVNDLDEDGKPGLKLAVAFERPVDLASAQEAVSVQIAGIKTVEWRLPTQPADKLVGSVVGSVEQNQLSVDGELASQLGKVKSTTCPSELGHVELVRGELDCAGLLAGRATNVDSYGLFDVNLDKERPLPEACPEPGCEADSDGDKVPDCRDGCPADALKSAPGACGCGMPDTNSDGDAAPDCLDTCASDPLKTAPGACGCGVPDTNTDGDAAPDCSDGCAVDPLKTAPGACGCGAPDTNSDGDAQLDCNETCDSDPLKLAPGMCGCGVADADLNGDGSIDCSDLCPSDPAKVAPGACGCDIADVDSDGDGALDCVDECDADPAKTVAGTCGCGVAESVCNNPLFGTYALRAVVHVRQRIGSGAPTTSRAISYGLVTITDAGGGAVSVSEQSCWAQTIPSPDETGGTIVYSWSKPAWVQATGAAQRSATANGDGTWTALATASNVGWNPATTCTSSTPPSGWPASWGATCTCNTTAQPPYDRDDAPYDCRLTDDDADGQPGISAYVSTSAPSAPDQDATGLSARAFAASRSLSHWTLTPQPNRRHTGTIRDLSQSNLVGCTGLACLGLSATSPATAPCPEALNPLQLVPVTTTSDTCAEIIAQRDTLFTATDPTWAQVAACPNP
ncbi:MAG: hypothetical protein ABW352_16500 [Polyangiales bacterium]